MWWSDHAGGGCSAALSGQSLDGLPSLQQTVSRTSGRSWLSESPRSKSTYWKAGWAQSPSGCTSMAASTRSGARGTANPSTVSVAGGSSVDSDDVATRWRRWTLAQQTTDPAPQVEAFHLACRKRYRTLGRSWRLALDPEAAGKVGYPRFHALCHTLGFVESVHALWASVDAEGAGFITLKQWDPTAFALLRDFGKACRRNYGGTGLAFKYGMDKSRSATMPLKELEVFCQSIDFKGSPKALFMELDKGMKGFVTVDDLDILESLDVAEEAKKQSSKQWTHRPSPSSSRSMGFRDTERSLLSMTGVQVSTPRSLQSKSLSPMMSSRTRGGLGA